MKKIASFISGNWELVLLYFGVVVVVLVAIYLVLAYVHTIAHRRVARVLKELLQTTSWADIVQIIKDEEYVQAVVDACEMALEGNG